MSSRFKRCKTCGTTNSSDFAPRKSVICKNCEASNSVIPEIISSSQLQEKIPLSVLEEKSEKINTTIISEVSEAKVSEAVSSTSETSENSDNIEHKETSGKDSSILSEEAFQIILHKFKEVETNYQLLKAEVESLGRLKKMFPRMFPEDDVK